MPILTDDQVNQLEATVAPRRVEAIDVDDQTVVLATPTRAEFDRWADSTKGSGPTRTLVRSCLLHPSSDELDGLLDANPALLMTTLADSVGRLSGLKKGSVRVRART